MDIKHFEELWVQAEEVSKPLFTSREEIYISIKSLIDEYSKLDKIPSPDIKNILKTKKLGELLFKVAELSRVDNVNTFSALQLEVNIADKINQ